MKTLTEDDLKDGITYDDFGRMKYHPEFHPNQRKPFTDDEIEYLCMFYGAEDIRTMGFSLGRTEPSVKQKYMELSRKGVIDFYKQSYYAKLV